MFEDMISRYIPDQLMTKNGMQPVTRVLSYPPGQHPKGTPIVANLTAVKCETPVGDRWFGCKAFRINAELRAVVQGTDSRDEVRMKWKPCRIP